jgi:hypothetical protein
MDRISALVLFVSTLVPLPIDTPIPCLICTGTAAQSTATFSGTVAGSDASELIVYDFVSRRSMTFVVPSDFHGVSSDDGTITDATLTRTPPGAFARVTYSSAHGRNVAVAVVVLRRETIPGRNALQ